MNYNIEYFSKEMGIKYTLTIILMFLSGLSINPIKAQGSFSAKEQIKLLKITSVPLKRDDYQISY